MRVVHPSVYARRYDEIKSRRRKRYRFGIPLMLGLVSYLLLAIPVTAPYEVTELIPVELAAEEPNIIWPATGSASISYDDASGTILASSAGTRRQAAASTAKMLTALLVIDKKPISADESGDLIIFDENDVLEMNSIASQDGVVLPITAGASMTYKQALEALLVTSANNIANKLAVWAYGSLDEFRKASLIYGLSIGLENSVLDDPSGLSPNTVTSADDLIRVSDKLLQNEVLSQIVMDSQVEIFGIQYKNTNRLLGIEGNDGIKTGFTDEAGACLVLSRTVDVPELGPKQFVVAVIGQPTRDDSFLVADNIMDQFTKGYQKQSLVIKDQLVAKVSAPWGSTAELVSASTLNAHKWIGESIAASSKIQEIYPSKSGVEVGELVYGNQSVPIIAKTELSGPNYLWKLTHVFDYYL